MIKAKKGLLITLFAAMMIFAFGATSVFAAESVEWTGTNCSTLKYTDADGKVIEYTDIIKTQKSDGSWTAEVDATKYSSLPTMVASAKAYYWDLAGAKLGYDNGGLKAIPVNFTYADWKVRFIDPNPVPNDAYVQVKDADGKYLSTWTAAGTSGVWKGVLKGFDSYDKNNTAAQSVTISYDTEWTAGQIAEGTSTNPFIFGTPDPVKVSVAAKPAVATDVALYWDEVSDTTGYTDSGIAYDGATHTVVSNTVEGFTVSYKVYDKGAWNDATSVSVTNVGEDVTFQVFVKNAKGEDVTPAALKGSHTAKVNTLAPAAIKFGFPTTTDSNTAVYYVEGAEYDAYSYIEALAPTAAPDYAKAAVEANQAELLAFFKEAYDVNAKVSKDDANKVTLTIAPKDLKDAEKDALIKKYETLFANFDIAKADLAKAALKGRITSGTEDIAASATVKLNQETGIAPEIEFVDSPTAVTYKAKKLKKKAASFTVTAVCSDGQAVTYKLIDAPAKITIDKATGEITLAKGLKKGKYNIRVKAYLAAQPQVVFETQAIKIKVKK